MMPFTKSLDEIKSYLEGFVCVVLRWSTVKLNFIVDSMAELLIVSSASTTPGEGAGQERERDRERVRQDR